VPIYFVVGDRAIYSFALPGQKIDWMRINPQVCLEADTIGASNEWTSVIVIGRYHELSEEADAQRERAFAERLLQGRPMWWQPGAVSLEGHDGARGYVPIVFRITVSSVSGYRGVSAADSSGSVHSRG
jgi:nitroimidazol reductase NimA-like FMN-containing flavoprotein (pyridoxamine 5'-phosphate oxidase superfamily)